MADRYEFAVSGDHGKTVMSADSLEHARQVFADLGGRDGGASIWLRKATGRPSALRPEAPKPNGWRIGTPKTPTALAEEPTS